MVGAQQGINIWRYINAKWFITALCLYSIIEIVLFQRSEFSGLKLCKRFL